MVRLIDADALKNTLIGLMDISNPVPSNNDCVIDGMLNLLGAQPTVEAVKHGHWKEELVDSGCRYLCSECGYVSMQFYGRIAFGDKYNYCPNCGAKMDKEFNI